MTLLKFNVELSATSEMVCVFTLSGCLMITNPLLPVVFHSCFIYKSNFSIWYKCASRCPCFTNGNFATLSRKIRTRDGEIFKKVVFTLKTQQMFSVFTAPEKFHNVTNTDHFRFVFEEDWSTQVTWLSWRHRLRKAPFLYFFRPYGKVKPLFSNFFGLKSVFKSSNFVTD